MANIIVMEPDRTAAERTHSVLENAGHSCIVCNDIPSGQEYLEKGPRSMTVLNARLPWKESLSFLRILEQKGLPVLFVISQSDSADHMKAMYSSDCAAVTQGCDPDELAAAVESLLSTAPATLTLGDVSLNCDTHVVNVNGRKLQLTRQEYELLLVLMSNPDAPVSREELLRKAWGYQSAGVITRTVDVHIQRLRRKLGEQYIETVYRLGYRFAA